jgi:hypothetical protein
VGNGVGIIHVHSNYSHDGLDPLERLKEFALERGIDFVGMTDHAEDFDPRRYDEFREHCLHLSDARVSLIPGLEFRFAGYPGLHLLALGLTRMVVPQTPEDFCSLIQPLAEFTIVAHPILPRYQIPDRVAESLDAIEVWNAAYNTRFLPDTRAVRLYRRLLARRPSLVATAGLDQHDSRNDRETRVLLHDPSAGNPLLELKAGRFTNRGRTMRFDSRANLGPVRLAYLTAARWSLDRVNFVHDRAIRLGRALLRGRR